MRTLGLLYEIDGKPQCHVDSTETRIELELRLQRMKSAFPENNARIGLVGVVENPDTERLNFGPFVSRGECDEPEQPDTLIPEAPDPFAPEAFRQTLETLTEGKKR